MMMAIEYRLKLYLKHYFNSGHESVTQDYYIYPILAEGGVNLVAFGPIVWQITEEGEGTPHPTKQRPSQTYAMRVLA